MKYYKTQHYFNQICQKTWNLYRLTINNRGGYIWLGFRAWAKNHCVCVLLYRKYISNSTFMDFFNAKIWAWFLILKLKDILQNWLQVKPKTAKKLLNCDGLNGHDGGGQNGVGTRRRLPRQNWRRRQQRRRQKRM